MKILYFSWLREKIGLDSEEIKISEKIGDVNELVEFLKKSSEKHSIAFQDVKSIKVAVNKDFASLNTKIQDQDEIAFFPPVTGG